MRVAHAIHGIGLGGAQKVVSTIVRGRRDRSLRYYVYSPSPGVEYETLKQAGATIRILPRILPKFDPIWLFRLAKAMRRDAIDVVHAHLFGDSLHGLLAARALRDVPVVLTLHSVTQSWSPLQRIAYPKLLAHCDRWVACSKAVESSVHAWDPGLAGNMVTIPNGIEAAPLEPGPRESLARFKQSLGAEEEDVLLAGIGRLSPEKGFDHLIAAMHRMCEAGPTTRARLVILGEGPERSKLEAKAAAGPAAKRICFTGFRPDILEILPALDIVVFSSLYEGLPIALLEAMATNRCIVATRTPGMLEAVRPGREAAIVPPADAESLADMLRKLANDAELRKSLGAAARARFLARFSATSMIERYESIYLDLSARRRSGDKRLSARGTTSQRAQGEAPDAHDGSAPQR